MMHRIEVCKSIRTPGPGTRRPGRDVTGTDPNCR